MLNIQVEFIGEKFSVMWEDGNLSGDFEATSVLLKGAKKFAGETHQGYTLPDNPLGDYESVLVLADIIFNEIVFTDKSLETKKGYDY